MATIVSVDEREGLRERRRRFLSTTPGRLRAESVVILVSVILTGLLASFVIADHGSSTRKIADESEPVIRSARQVQTSLAEANAAAATAFLAGGSEDPNLRAEYTEALDAAATELEMATRLIGDNPEATEALGSMSRALPRYAGLIETARANNRQGYPVGAAYLDTASSVLETEIYPATDTVANQAAADYRRSYDRQRGLALILALVAIVLLVIVVLLLVWVLFQLRRRFNRTLNLPILAATIIAFGLTVWMASSMSSQISHLTAARTDGYEGTRLYLDLRGTGFGAKADEARFLIARGAGDGFLVDFDRRAAAIAEMRPALDAHADDSADRSAASALATDTFAAWDTYAATNEEVAAADASGERTEAVDLALGRADTDFAAFDAVTSEALESNRLRFVEEMDQAARATQGLRFGSLLLATLVAALALYGLQLRINEYR